MGSIYCYRSSHNNDDTDDESIWEDTDDECSSIFNEFEHRNLNIDIFLENRQTVEESVPCI